jgi:hypothetical protein
LRHAALAMREGAPHKAVESARAARSVARPGTSLAVAAATTLSQALWSSGRARDALGSLAGDETVGDMHVDD